jgi:hypothetical protein
MVEKAHRTGDVTLGLKQNLSNPDGNGFSLAVLPSISLPVGREPIGAGTWEASLLVPASWELNDAVQLQLTPEVDAAADEDGKGRHLAWGTAAGVNIELTKALDLDLEVKALRDRDPGEHRTEALAGVAFALKLGDNLQLDLGGTAGLNHASADVEAYGGIVRRF